MSRNRFVVITAVLVVSLVASSSTARSQSQGLLTLKAISLDMAQAMVQAAIAKCRADNYRISVHVLDGDGQVKASARDDGSELRRKPAQGIHGAHLQAPFGRHGESLGDDVSGTHHSGHVWSGWWSTGKSR